jgi:hypothetical protein
MCVLEGNVRERGEKDRGCFFMLILIVFLETFEKNVF